MTKNSWYFPLYHLSLSYPVSRCRVGGMTYKERRFLCVNLLSLESRKFQNSKEITATKASAWYVYMYGSQNRHSGFYVRSDSVSTYISYRRGLTGVAYPLSWAMREPERRDKQESRFPRLFFI